ncbi:MAG: hypothetical protein PHH75_00415 [Candidatus Omnitrophica bacterium]|nr:hypothetical protein [Candidatus Omnitrophota bacterium]MDD5573629.1 hypothetical protein [Candidatus Omnitrophota bacterium]
MFTKADYREYFQTISNKEKTMIVFLSQLMPLLEDERLIEELRHVLRDEVRHAQLADILFEQLV